MGLRVLWSEATLAAWGGVAEACDVVRSAGAAEVATAGSLVLASRFQSQAAAGPAAKATAAKVVTTRSFVMARLLLKWTVLYHDRGRSGRSRNRKQGPSWTSKPGPTSARWVERSDTHQLRFGKMTGFAKGFSPSCTTARFWLLNRMLALLHYRALLAPRGSERGRSGSSHMPTSVRLSACSPAAAARLR